MEIFLPSWRVNSTHPVSMLNEQALASYFIIVSSKRLLCGYGLWQGIGVLRRPREPSFSNPKKTKNPNPSPIGNRFGFFLFGGRGWIRTTEAESSRFTVCPHWPLGNTPIFSFAVHGLPVYITTRMVVCQHLLRNFWIFVPKAKVQKQKPPRNQRSWAAFWSWWQELNLQPTDYKSVALPLRHTSKGYLNSITQARPFGKDCFLAWDNNAGKQTKIIENSTQV